MIDLRSDTVTKPTPAMRQAIADAEVGDDVLGDDPTVQALEKRTAEILGTEAAVYMPSGTMTNQVAIRAHTEPGDEILIDAESHCYFYEAGAPGGVAGVMCRLLPGIRGIFSADDVKAALRPANYHFPPTKLLCVENTHNRGGGSVWPIERIAEVAEIARDADLKLHLDGARLWNASVATGVSERIYAGYFDSVSVCFSKGLGAPIGSALAGSAEFIHRARRFRKMLGGAMRQVGTIAAGALYALEYHRTRLVEDHTNAQTLAAGIAELTGIELNPADVQTNIVTFKVTSMPAAAFSDQLEKAGVRTIATGPDTIRAVTHLDISADQIAHAVEIIKNLVS